MTVLDRGKVDGMGIGKDGSSLVLLLSDHLDWEDEAGHLLALQEKINAYLGFIESGQYRDVYPGREFGRIEIEVHFKHAVTENCRKFVDIANGTLSALNAKCVIVES